MQFELIDRYVYAVVKRLPQKQRADVEKELRTLIADMLEQRCGDVPPTEHDVRVVLTELGTPGELAGKYDPDAHAALIGPPYYTKYKLILKIVLLAAGGGMLLANLLTFAMQTPAHPLLNVMQGIGSIFMAEVWAFAFVTALFAFFERKGVKFDADESFNDLPPVPVRQENFKRTDPVVGIAFSVVLLLVFLLAGPRYIGWYGPEGFVPMFSAAVFARLWPLLAAACALGLVKDTVRILEGRYTWRLAWVTLATGVPSAVLVGSFLLAQGLVTPAFTAAITKWMGGALTVLPGMFSNFLYLFFAVFCFATVLDILTSFVRAARGGREAA